MQLEHETWIKELQREALVEEMCAQERDIERVEYEIKQLDARIDGLAFDLQELRAQHLTLINQRVTHGRSRTALKEALGL